MPRILWIIFLLLSYYDAVKEVTGTPIDSNGTSTPIIGTITSATVTTNTPTGNTEVTSSKSCKTRTARPTVVLENCVEIEDRIISLLLSRILLIINEVYSAPKLGGVMFEQLLLETLIDDENNTNAHYNEKRAFTVPAYHADIKNTTSLYAKLTGYSMSKPVHSDSEHSYEKANVLNHTTTNSSFTIANASVNNSSGFRKGVSPDTNAGSMSKLISMKSLTTTTVRKNVESRVSDPENPEGDKIIKSERKIKVNTGVNKSKAKENVRRYPHSRNGKSRRDGAILQSNGYAYNHDICQMRGDRVICGYNNQELSEPAIESKPEKNDCLTRGDRIECGYAKSMADNNRRNIKQKSAKNNGSEILAFNVTTKLTTTATITSDTTYSTTVTNPPVPTATAEMSTTNTPSPANKKDELDSSKLEAQTLIDHIETMISSIIMNSNISTFSSRTSPTSTSTTGTDTSPQIIDRASPTSSIDNDPKISVSKIMELISRVEKIMAATATNSTSSATLPISGIETKLSKALEMLSRVEKILQSLVSTDASTHTTAATIFTTNSTPNSSTTISASPFTSTTTTSTRTPRTTSSTTISTTTTTTTPEPYIDEREFCVEKDGRIVCYDKTQEEYEEDFLEK